MPCHLSLATAVLPGNPHEIPAAPDVRLVLRVCHGAILNQQVGAVGLWGTQESFELLCAARGWGMLWMFLG